MAYTAINIQMTPIYLTKELDLPRKYGLDAELLMIPVSSPGYPVGFGGRDSASYQGRNCQH
jgi:hypothetical protein